ncbi:spore cortex-lytic enzyme [Tissierella sp. MB52-C2]|uniref:spore cortex-lytic enzyme n=1 Tax=Tissierella sp. MB52-C2 TaxID=3070999 RepID=UPI00280BBAA0|nr:spore cortex-lytic enzyme [Tissierella sp. MB52-C2]WMM24355.1 spore cortex-lytic enzyme [Tissierella sp. MB52-C2]
MKKFIIITTVLSMVLLSVFSFYEPHASTQIGFYAPRILYWGSQGQDVRTVQDKLLRWGYYDGRVDGVYAARTYRAVRKFQAKNGLTVDGVVGTSTAKALGMTTAATTTTTSTAGVDRKTDEYLLARAIHGEARGEPYVGKVAVAAVILNRTRSSSFPNTVASVIYQPLAFTAVADGQINLTPNKDSINAARDALNGWDPTYGCLYYWNPVTATSKWIWSRKVMLKIGKHWFGV